MTSASSEPPAASPSAPVESLRRVRATEIDWEQRLTEFREEAQRGLTRLREQSEVLVRTARIEVERRREASVAAARARAEQEAQAILSKGQAEADRILSAPLPEPRRLQSDLLEILFGEFRESAPS